MNPFQQRTGVRLPIVQAPMAGVSTPAMAAAVSNAGALGSISVGAMSPRDARQAIVELAAATNRPFNVNVFCHRPPRRDAGREAAWLARLAPTFLELGAAPPAELHEVYRSFLESDEMLAVLLETRPPIVSLHFGLPGAARLQALRKAGVVLMATATSLAEAREVADAGVDIIVSQGIEAGGHRGVFDEQAPDAGLGTLALTRIIASVVTVPVVAAGGIMDGAGIAACLSLGASAAQLGTAFIDCPESSADAAHRAALRTDAAHRTVFTRTVSGRPARGIPTRLTVLGGDAAADTVPAYPIAYDAARALSAAARRAGVAGFAVQWAGQGAPLARTMPAARLVERLDQERLEASRS